MFIGTLGGSIHCFDYQSSKMAFKLNGHLSDCCKLVAEKSVNPRLLVSGAIDTNVKVWDIRARSCINTFKSHMEEITCIDISPDNRIVASGSVDGTIKLWDLPSQKLIKSIQVTASGHPKCLAFNPRDLCVAVATSDRVVKYWELSDY